MNLAKAAGTMDKKFAPYAPPSTVLAVIRHFRDRDVPDRFTATLLLQLGVAETLTARVLRSLQFVGLLDEGFVATPEFRKIPAATAEEYKAILAGLIRSAYSEIFRLVDVANAQDEALHNAFRPYSPAGQRSRMVILFSELCREAAMRIAGSMEEPRISAPRIRLQVKKSAHVSAPDKVTSRLEVASIGAPIMAILEELPRTGRSWTKVARDRWLRALEAILDYSYPTQPDEPQQGNLWNRPGEDDQGTTRADNRS